MRMSFLIALILIGALAVVSGCATLNVEKNAPPIGDFIDVSGERLHYIDLPPETAAGEPPIVLIHGASVNLRDMKLALGPELSKTHRVIIVDRPGRGYSTRPEDGWKLERQADLIHGVVEALGVNRPIVVGQSFGGAVALRYALKYQDEMSGLVLLAAVSHEWPTGIAWYNSVSGWPVAGFLLRRLVIPVYGQLAAESGIRESFAPDTPPENYFERAGLALLFRPKDFKSNAADIRNLKPQVVAMSDRYNSIEIPTAIVTGTADTTVSPDIHSRQLAEDIDHATLTLLPDTGHALHHAETARVAEIIRAVASKK